MSRPCPSPPRSHSVVTRARCSFTPRLASQAIPVFAHGEGFLYVLWLPTPRRRCRHSTRARMKPLQAISATITVMATSTVIVHPHPVQAPPSHPGALSCQRTPPGYSKPHSSTSNEEVTSHLAGGAHLVTLCPTDVSGLICGTSLSHAGLSTLVGALLGGACHARCVR